MAVKTINDNLMLICGGSTGGKSASLRNLIKPEGVMFLNIEANKKLPFPAKFIKAKTGEVGFKILDPHQVFEAFDQAEKMPEVHTIVGDSLTFLLEMYVSQYVLPAKDTMKGWSNFQQYFKKLMQFYVARSTKNVIFTAHVQTVMNEQEMILEKKVPVQGALKNNGIEAYFSTIVSARTMPVAGLEKYKNGLLNITPQEEIIGVKHVYQTQLTKETVNERIRASIGMWSMEETFIDNDAQLVLDRLHQYHGTAVAA